MLDAARATLMAATSGWAWQEVGAARFRVEGNQLMLAVPQISSGLRRDQLHLISIGRKMLGNCTALRASSCAGMARPRRGSMTVRRECRLSLVFGRL